MMKQNILITGGAGYIGSHVAMQLLEEGRHSITILDNFSSGYETTVETLLKIGNFHVKKIDLKDFDEVETFLNEHSFDAIVHFAASISAPESVIDPAKYYMNNTANTINLIRCANKTGIKKFIFSSTAAVYGNTEDMPVTENTSALPINPYGSSKLMSEQVLRDVAGVNPDFKYVIFRYFNVAGADSLGRIGQSNPNAMNLIKIAAQCALGKCEKLQIFGDDYETRDGTGIRDYIHVTDLATAHLTALDYLDGEGNDLFNVGYGCGVTVKEVISMMKKVSGIDFKVETVSRRTGDIEISVADCSKIKSRMNWQPECNDLELICQTSLDWEKKLMQDSKKH